MTIEDAINFGLSLVGTPYDYWKGGDIQILAPMFAINGPCPNKKDIVSANCVGLVNLMLRYVGKEIPYDIDTCGGIYAYSQYYKFLKQPFDIQKSYPKGTLLIRNYRNIYDQGHLAVILEDKGRHSKILQSHVEGEWFKSTSPGVNTNHTLDESHKSFYDTNNNPCYYEFAVLPENWLV